MRGMDRAALPTLNRRKKNTGNARKPAVEPDVQHRNKLSGKTI